MNYCPKHKKYKGKKLPTNQCVDCLNLYLKLHSTPRMPIKPSIPMRDKTKYNRKQRNKKRDEDL